MRSSLKEALERQERDRNGGAGHHPSGIPVELVLQISASNDQPVDLVKALMAFGLDLHEAHDIVDRLAIGEKVATTLYLTAEGESPFALSRFGVMVGAPQPVDAASIPVDVLNAIEAWRLSEPERPTRDEAIGIILRRGLAAA